MKHNYDITKIIDSIVNLHEKWWTFPEFWVMIATEILLPMVLSWPLDPWRPYIMYRFHEFASCVFFPRQRGSTRASHGPSAVTIVWSGAIALDHHHCWQKRSFGEACLGTVDSLPGYSMGLFDGDICSGGFQHEFYIHHILIG